ncbi:MAG: SCO family protein [Gammaproteobacteria bacterium]|nr:SCO family protein [Gammaproteobacteria bacterium]
MSTARRILAIVFLFTAFSGGAVFRYLALFGGPKPPAFATVMPMTIELPDTALVDDGGRLFTRDTLRGHQSVLFFGFTNCPDICPATLSQLAIAKKRLAENGIGFPDIYLVSVDPERDTPAVLTTYVGHFDASITGLTGSPDDIAAFTKPLGIYYEKSGDVDGDYSVDHSSVVLVINENAEWYALFSAPHSVDAFVHDLPILSDAG